MRFSMIVRVMVVALLATCVVLAGTPWKNKSYMGWTADEVQAVLTDSPWARKVRSYRMGTRIVVDQAPSTADRAMIIGGNSDQADDSAPPTRGETSRPSGDLKQKTIIVVPDPVESRIPAILESHKFELLWLSADTVRRGIVRRRVLEGTLTAEEGEKLLVPRLDHYVLALSGPGIYSLSTVSEDEIKSAILKTYKGDDSIPLEQYFRGTDTSGDLVQILFYFPRESNGETTLTPAETRVTFLLETQAGKIEVKFNLAKMMLDGEPDI